MAVGIDLGTTNSCVATLVGDRPDLIVNAEGERVTASVVGVSSAGQRLVGQAAKRQAVVNPENTVFSVKRFVGRKLEGPAMEALVAAVPYPVRRGPGGDARISLEGKLHSPEELSSMILQKLRADAEDHLGREVVQAVITVPAYFDDKQRTATRDAGRIAGLEVLQIINEPTAAALAYGLGRSANQTLAVYDLGGGTFDITIMEQTGTDFRVLSTAGDTALGGDDVDRVLIEWMRREFRKANAVDLPGDPTVQQRLRTAAEALKKDLSSSASARASAPFIAGSPTGPLHLELELQRDEFDELVAPLLERTLGPCRRALADAGLGARDVDAVLLVGGQTRSPIVQQTVERFFGRAPLKGINPDEAVALGAAVAAGIKTGEIEGVSLKDVTPLSLGIGVADGRFRPLIARNTPIPVTAQKVFTTSEDHQVIIRVHVCQGEQARAADNRTLGLFDLLGVRPAPAGESQIEITFEIDENGIVHVTAADLASGRAQRIRITDAGGLSEREIAKLAEEAAVHREAHVAERRRLVARNEAAETLAVAEQALAGRGPDSDPALTRELREAVHKLQGLLQSEVGTGTVQRGLERLVGVLDRL